MRIQILGCQIFKTLQLTLESANLVTFTEEILIGKIFFFVHCLSCSPLK